MFQNKCVCKANFSKSEVTTLFEEISLNHYVYLVVTVTKKKEIKKEKKNRDAKG